ncbi:MAG: DegV family protein [Actinobacteria bacterium]|nr:MAG: DegV family protein [Actinomycetota bacterium]
MGDTERSFAIITDSTADLPGALAAENGIAVVPLLVSFGDDSFPDGTLTQQQFFARMAAATKLPTTSQPSVGAFTEAYEHALETADEVLSIHISSGLSGTVAAARQAAESFAGQVHVFDSRNLSGGLALQVLDAAHARSAGMNVSDTIARLGKTRDRAKMIVGLDSLENLARGGRIGKVSAFVGSLLDLKVTLTLDEDGKFTPVKRTRGEKAALAHTLDWIEAAMGGAQTGVFAVGHAMSAERARIIRDQIEARFDATDIIMYEAGSVVSTHTGTVWGVAVLPASV